MIILILMILSIVVAIIINSDLYKDICGDIETIKECSSILHDSETRRAKYQRVLKSIKNDRISRQK